MRTLQDFRRHVEAKAKEQGPEALAHLAAERARFRLARQLVEARKAMGLTQARVARLAGLSQGDISRIESARVNASGDSLARLAYVYGGELVFEPKRRRPPSRTAPVRSRPAARAPAQARKTEKLRSHALR